MDITYLIGAGASAGGNKLTYNEHAKSYGSVIPVVQNFNNGLIQFIRQLAAQTPVPLSYQSFKPTSKEALIQDVSTRMGSFIQDLELHHSVDTLARKYFVKYGLFSEELRFLKVCVSLFILYRQYRYGLDPRYDLFFAAIGKKTENGEFELPQKVNILSWNYDTQIELSYSSFFTDLKVASSKSNLNLHPRLKHHGEDYGDVDVNKFSVVKLNGSCDVVSKNDINTTIESLVNQRITTPMSIDFSEIGLERAFSKNERGLFERLLLYYKEAMTQSEVYQPLLSFSWEEDDRLSPARDIVSAIAQRTGILVVIGYSFPTFNRSLDSLIMDGLFEKGALRKIYVQTPVESFDSIRSKIAVHFRRRGIGDWNNYIEHIPQLDEFYVPYELDIKTNHKASPIKMKF